MKNYKIVRISTIASVIKEQIYLDNPLLQTLSYQQQHNFILQGFYTYADSFSRSMNGLGNESVELLFDIEKLQKQWAKENNLHLQEGQHWQVKIITAQLKKIKPDVVYIQGMCNIDSIYLESIKEQIPNLRLIVQYTGAPFFWEQIDNKALLLVGTPHMREQAKERGLNATLVYHSFDPEILKQIKIQRKKYNFSFAGSSGFGYGYIHKSRFWDLLKLSYNTPIQMWLDELELLHRQCNDSPFNKVELKKEYSHNLNYNVSEYPAPICKLSYLIPEQKWNSSVHGLAYFQVLADSHLTYHRHGDVINGFAGAMRMFEATGVRSCLITDNQKNLSDIFEPDKEVVTYNSLSECVEKVNYLLEHPDEMYAIAQAGQKKTLEHHTIEHRVKYIHELILTKLNQ